MEEMTEEELLSLLKEQESDASSFHSSELAAAQTEAMKRFYAEPYGDEIEGRSRIVTHELEETINWLMPKLMRTFMDADELVFVDDPSTDDPSICGGVAELLKHVFFKDNDGESVIHDFAFDGLLQRIGAIRVGWADPTPKPPRLLEGVSVEQLMRYQADPEYEILEQEQTDAGQAGLMPGMPPALPVFSLLLRHTPRMGRVVVEAIPPEEYAFSRRSRSAKTSDYQRWKRETFLADLKRIYPDKAPELDALGTDDGSNGVFSDGRSSARFQGESDGGDESRATKGRRKVWLCEEEILVDYDGDGITERRHIKRVGDVILENVQVERSAFVSWTPVRVSHKIAGRSLSDLLIDLMKIKTRILRNTLDAMSQSLVPRPAVNMSMADEHTLAAIVDADIGAPIPVQGPVSDAIAWQTSPDLSGQGLSMLEYMDQKAEIASGVTRHAQGLRAEAITDTKGGIEALQNAANDRIELIARWLGKSLQDVFENILHLLAAHQDQPRVIKIRGKPVPIDPRSWSDEMSVNISVGMTVENRQTQLQNIAMIAGWQKELLLNAPNNPIVGLPELRNSLALATERLGFKSAVRFFREVPEGYQPPPPPPDPKAEEMKAKMQLEQEKAQVDARLSEAKLKHEAAMNEAKLQSERMLQAAKLEGEQRIAEMRLATETRLAQMKMQTEKEMSVWKMAQDVETVRQRDKMNVRQKSGGPESIGRDVEFGGAVG